MFSLSFRHQPRIIVFIQLRKTTAEAFNELILRLKLQTLIDGKKLYVTTNYFTSTIYFKFKQFFKQKKSRPLHIAPFI